MSRVSKSSTPALEGDDLSAGEDVAIFNAEPTPANAIPDPTPDPTPDASPASPAPYQRPCALDDAPVGSKIVVVMQADKKTPLMATPAGMIALAPDDIAHRLPVGAKVRKVAEGQFVAEQLDATLDKPDLPSTTAREAILGFAVHFHDAKPE